MKITDNHIQALPSSNDTVLKLKHLFTVVDDDNNVFPKSLKIITKTVRSTKDTFVISLECSHYISPVMYINFFSRLDFQCKKFLEEHC